MNFTFAEKFRLMMPSRLTRATFDTFKAYSTVLLSNIYLNVIQSASKANTDKSYRLHLFASNGEQIGDETARREKEGQTIRSAALTFAAWIDR